VTVAFTDKPCARGPCRACGHTGKVAVLTCGGCRAEWIPAPLQLAGGLCARCRRPNCERDASGVCEGCFEAQHAHEQEGAHDPGDLRALADVRQDAAEAHRHLGEIGPVIDALEIEVNNLAEAVRLAAEAKRDPVYAALLGTVAHRNAIARIGQLRRISPAELCSCGRTA